MKLWLAYQQLMDDDDKSVDLVAIERLLKIKMKTEQDFAVKFEFELLLLICLLRQNKIENSEMKQLFLSLKKEVYILEKVLRSGFVSSKKWEEKMLLDVFYKTSVYRFYLLSIYFKRLWLVSRAQAARVISKDMELRQSYVDQNYSSFTSLFFNKITSNYWTSFVHLSFVVFVLLMFFAGTFYAWDVMNENHPVWLGTLMDFSYYFYVAIINFTWLGWDVSQAGDFYLITMLSLSQIVWIIVFWIYVILVWKKFE